MVESSSLLPTAQRAVGLPGRGPIYTKVFTMPKMKTNKAVAKRIKVTGTGKLRRRRPLSIHLKSSKSPKRIRALRKSRTLSKGFTKHAKRMLGI